ncbi:hypothetical protein HAX54_031238 [Datura stramonium]|uniref:Trimethylguanosine synthase n=1 Tax=Datura stramonium TaxID=4076 RepID=A0ABS8V9A7_DATST|nr:hypothetical protein [Datura stramonium]
MESVTLYEEEGSAIAALGSLFKLTEVHLSDYSQEGKLFLDSTNTEVCKNNASTLNEFGSSPEDLELARQMNEMGLPVSFHTNKEHKRNRTVKGNIKDGKKKNLSSCESTQDEVLNSIQEQKEECESNGTLHGNSNKASSCMSILGQSEFSSCYTGDGDVHCLNGGEEGLNSLSSDIAHTSLECIACNQQSDLSPDNSKDTVSTCEKVQLEKDVGVMVGSCLECGNHAEICPINSSVDSGCISGEGLNSHCERNPLNGEQMEYACMGSPLTGEQVESIAMQTAEHHTEDGILWNDVGEELNSCNTTNNNCEATINDWRLYWDNDYQRNYFYNIVTLQCTWDPPPGMDDLVFTNYTTKQPEMALEMMELDVADLKESNDLQTSASLPSDLNIADRFREDDVLLDGQHNESEGTGQSADNLCTLSSTKQKRRVRNTKFKWKLPTEAQELNSCNVNGEISPSLNKYWCQRYQLFNKYDEGIKMDEEGWFSVTPEAIAKHHALRCGSGSIVDFFTGVGGNSIQFAKRSKHVIAIDIDPKRIDLAQYNAAIYGVRDQIDFIRGDSFVLAPTLKADVVFMSPPWGGPDYLKERTFDMITMLRPHDGNVLFSTGRGIAPKVVMFLPRNVDLNQLAELSLSANPPWLLELTSVDPPDKLFSDESGGFLLPSGIMDTFLWSTWVDLAVIVVRHSWFPLTLVLAGKFGRALLVVSRSMELRGVKFLVVCHGKMHESHPSSSAVYM